MTNEALRCSGRDRSTPIPPWPRRPCSLSASFATRSRFPGSIRCSPIRVRADCCHRGRLRAGKIKTAGARAVLARYLMSVAAGPRNRDAIGEALLSIGRSTTRGDIAPIAKWTTSPDEEIRWRATWALFRPRDPSAVAQLLRLSDDRSAHVRSWAVRGLVKSQADSASLGERAEAKLLAALRDDDRRVRTEAIRALGTYSDSLAITALVNGLTSPDAWISVSAAEGLGRSRLVSVVPALVGAADATRPCALRATAIRQLQPFANTEARTAAAALARDTVPYCQNLAAQILRDTSTTGRGGAAGGAPAATARRAAVRRVPRDRRTLDRAGLHRKAAPAREIQTCAERSSSSYTRRTLRSPWMPSPGFSTKATSGAASSRASCRTSWIRRRRFATRPSSATR